MNDAERRTLLDLVDIDGAEAGTARGKDQRDKRKEPRWTYRDRPIAIVVEHPAGGISRYLATPRNISAGGLAFLHGGFLHKASKCRVELVRLDGKAIRLVGQVAACRHVEGLVHEVGLKFEQVIDPSHFVRIQSDDSPLEAISADHMSVEVPHLNDDLLYVDHSSAEQKFLTHQLKSTGINLSSATTPNEAKRLVKAKPFDMIVCDLNLNGYDGLDLIKSLREHGFNGPIAASANEADTLRVAGARKAGISHVLIKPYSTERLMSLLVTLHGESEVAKRAAASKNTSETAVAAAAVPVEASHHGE